MVLVPQLDDWWKVLRLPWWWPSLASPTFQNTWGDDSRFQQQSSPGIRSCPTRPWLPGPPYFANSSGTTETSAPESNMSTAASLFDHAEVTSSLFSILNIHWYPWKIVRNTITQLHLYLEAFVKFLISFIWIIRLINERHNSQGLLTKSLLIKVSKGKTGSREHRHESWLSSLFQLHEWASGIWDSFSRLLPKRWSLLLIRAHFIGILC